MRFETRAQVDKYLDGDKILCLICGKEYEFLGSHLKSHRMSPKAYREQFGLPIGAPLAGKAYRQKHTEIIAEMYKNDKLSRERDPERMKKMAPLGVKAFREHARRTRRKNIWKGSGNTLNGQQRRAKFASKMGDPEPLKRYEEAKKQRRLARKKQIAARGLKTTEEVMRETGISQSAISRIAQKIGVKKVLGLHKNSYGWSGEDIEKAKASIGVVIKEKIPGAKSLPEVAAMFEVGDEIVRRFALKNNIYWYGNEHQKHYQFTEKDIEAFRMKKTKKRSIVRLPQEIISSIGE
jgi:hypothetical protein